MFTQIMMLLAAVTLPTSTSAANQTPIPKPIERPAECEGKTFATMAEAMQSGCCSWHGGVCGCSNGRKTCCDGSASPSCGC